MRVRIRINVPDMLWGTAFGLAALTAPVFLVFQGQTGTQPVAVSGLVHVPPAVVREPESPVVERREEKPAVRARAPRVFGKRRMPEVALPEAVPAPMLAAEAPELAPRGPWLGTGPAAVRAAMPGSVAVSRRRSFGRAEAGTLVPFQEEMEYRSVKQTARLRVTEVRRTSNGFLVKGYGAAEKLDLTLENPEDAARIAAMQGQGTADGGVNVNGKPTEWRLWLK